MDKLGNELTLGATVIYVQTNHSVSPMLGTVMDIADNTVVIATGTTHRTIIRNQSDVIVYKGEA